MPTTVHYMHSGTFVKCRTVLLLLLLLLLLLVLPQPANPATAAVAAAVAEVASRRQTQRRTLRMTGRHGSLSLRQRARWVLHVGKAAAAAATTHTQCWHAAQVVAVVSPGSSIQQRQHQYPAAAAVSAASTYDRAARELVCEAKGQVGADLLGRQQDWLQLAHAAAVAVAAASRSKLTAAAAAELSAASVAIEHCSVFPRTLFR
jgi:hypothetical protein